jgi:4-cresol dehydrogenase (hydroxylating)
MWFSPIIPRTGEAVFEAQRVLGDAVRDMGSITGPFIIPTMYWLRAFVLIIGVPITRNVETNKKNRAAMTRLIALAAEHGWGEYRTPPVFQDAVMGAYSFNNNALLRFHETLKDAVDPNGILAAGRYGIWPKHLRGAKR